MKSRAVLFAAVWFAFIVFVTYLADTGGAPWLFAWIERVPGSDKVGHFFLIGGLAFLANLALRGRRVPLFGRRLLLGSLAVLVVFTAEEYSQKFNRRRHFDYGDLAADYAGIFCVAWLATRAHGGRAAPMSFR